MGNQGTGLWLLEASNKETPFTFFISSCQQVLGAIINKLYVNGHYEGFVTGKEKIHIPILQYTDDTLLFCKYDEDLLLKLKEAIRLFEWSSGQKINRNKSALRGVNVDDEDLSQMARKLGCKAGKLPFLYLGLPLGGYPRQKLFWQPVIDRVHKELDRLKRFNISRGGRQTVCKSVLANLPTYYSSLFAIPDNVTSSLNEKLLLGRAIRK